MSNFIYSTTKDYLKLAYTEQHTIVRPANTAFTSYSFPLLYTDTNYVPAVFGTFAGVDGSEFQLQQIISTLPVDQPYCISVSSTSGNIVLGAFGKTADATVYNIVCTVYVLINSVAEL